MPQKTSFWICRSLLVGVGEEVSEGGRLCRYVLRRAWSDGTTHLLFEPVEFLEKLAALRLAFAPPHTPKTGIVLLTH